MKSMPEHIKKFEQLMLVSQLISVINMLLNYKLFSDAFGKGFTMATFVVAIAITLTLVFFISRRQSNTAKWIFVVIWGLGFLPFVASLETYLSLGIIGILIIAPMILQIVAFCLLFSPQSKAWLKP